MYQVGDQIELKVYPVPSGSTIYSYVWDFWDGSSTATTTPFVFKVINIGGQPGTDVLAYTCRPVATDGQTVTLAGTLTANNRPTILPGVSISNNDDFFAYQTRMQLQAIDMDGDAFSFAWYNGTTYLGAGTTTAAGNVTGTWTGNGTTIIQDYPSSSNYLDATVVNTGIARCYVVDVRGGTAAVSFLLRGEANPNPTASITAGIGGLGFDSALPPTARVGPNQYVDFTVYVAPLPSHSVEFAWNFAGTNHWSMPPAAESGTLYALANGGVQNTVHRDISTEVISTGTVKVVTADVTVKATNIYNAEVTRTALSYTISLVKNTPPESAAITRSINGVPVAGPVATGALIEFAAAGTDADKDVMFYEWKFVQPFAPTPLYLWGPKVLYSTVGYSPGASVEGQLTVADWLGASLVTVLPSTSIV